MAPLVLSVSSWLLAVLETMALGSASLCRGNFWDFYAIMSFSPATGNMPKAEILARLDLQPDFFSRRYDIPAPYMAP
ncbi:hypothetical protein J7T55_011118 [Diaporthe amygdali]|uniref:uncharacterized protein n=1 Tax=Phomopsis amygdali TaxID=1214568 RepID=UPI0022FF1AAB|nr:uncharacterized protein J7T55_011118 [Diaporthe amygdali]KAJ0104334.1 hypothetical protein J7T55_011118 [Diaporthe amygdali]